MSDKNKLDNKSKVIRLRKMLRRAGVSEFEIKKERGSGPYILTFYCQHPTIPNLAHAVLLKLGLIIHQREPCDDFCVNNLGDYYEYQAYIRCRRPFDGFHDLSTTKNGAIVQARGDVFHYGQECDD